jgi:hypothetical protein
MNVSHGLALNNPQLGNMINLKCELKRELQAISPCYNMKNGTILNKIERLKIKKKMNGIPIYSDTQKLYENKQSWT